MTIDEIVELLNASLPRPLTPLQELVLRSSWEGKTYVDMAAESNYVKEYISRTASELWNSLSDFWGEPIAKPSFRRTLEPRPLTKAQREAIAQFRRQSAAPALKYPGGPVAIDSNLYIERPPIEELAREEVTKPGSIIRIKAPWKMGKTSLMLRILAYAEQQGCRTASLDFLQAERAAFASTEKFLRWFCANVTRALELQPKLDEYWDEDIGSKVSCTIYFEAYLLGSLRSPLVLALNEVNVLFEYPEIAEEFLSLLRSWYEQAKKAKIWQTFRLVVAYSTEIYIPLKLNQSPFNVGLPLKLPPFAPEQVQELARRHSLSWTNAQTKQLMAMVGGHPYLLRLAFYYLFRGDVTLKQLLELAATEAGIYNDHLRRILSIVKAEAPLESALKQVISSEGSVKLEAILAYKLDRMGVVTLEGDRVSPSCDLYRLYFRNQLLQI